MDILIFLFAALLIIFAVGLFSIFKKRTAKNERDEQPVQVHEGPSARRRALAANRSARVRQRVIINEDDDEDEGAAEAPTIELPEGKVGAKKLAKLQAKAEKKAQRQAEEKIREEKKKAQEIADEERKRAEEKEKEEERKRLEEEKKIREEKERQEHEEYLKLKEAFSIQEEGFQEAEESETLQDFIDHIKTNKIVVLEDLAAQFRLKTQDVINRINSLQADNQLTGVIDDRGKFIYISQEELDAVAKFVKQRGRVSIVELVENSNLLIDLSPAA